MDNMHTDGIAYLSNKNSYICFEFQDRRIRFKGPYSLVKIENIKKWDNGYIVVEAQYSHSSELIEDYIDLIPILENLYIDPETFLAPIRKVELQYA